VAARGIPVGHERGWNRARRGHGSGLALSRAPVSSYSERADTSSGYMGDLRGADPGDAGPAPLRASPVLPPMQR